MDMSPWQQLVVTSHSKLQNRLGIATVVIPLRTIIRMSADTSCTLYPHLEKQAVISNGSISMPRKAPLTLLSVINSLFLLHL